MKYKSILTTALLNTLIVCAASQASAIPLLAVPLTPGDNSGGFDLSYSPGCLCFPVTDHQNVTGPSAFSNTLSGLGLGGSIGGSLTVTNSPTPSINVSATLSGVSGLPPAGSIVSGGSVSMGAVTNYSFEISGPLAIPSAVSLMVNAQGGVGFTALSSNEGTLGILSANLQVSAANNGPVIVQELLQIQSSHGTPSTVTSDGFTIASDHTFLTNTLYNVRLQVGLSDSINGTGTEPLFAFIDPSFTIDGPNSGAYSIFFSEGFGNDSVPATPLPAALPLFATGLGALGLLGWCRKRKAAALAA